MASGTNRRLLSPEFDSAAKAQEWQRAQEQEEAVPRASLPRIGRNLGRVIDAYVQEAGRADGVLDPNGPSTDEQIRELREALSYVDLGLRSIDVSEVRQDDVQRLVDQLWEAGLSAGRIASVTQALAAVYSYAMPRGLVDHSPVVNLSLPQPDRGNGAQTQRMAMDNGSNLAGPTAIADTGGLGAPVWANGVPYDTPPPATAGFDPPRSYPTQPDRNDAPPATPPPGYATAPPGYTPVPGYAPTPGFTMPPPGYTPMPGQMPTAPGYPTPQPEYRPFAPEYPTPPPGYIPPPAENGFTGGYSTPPINPQGYLPPTTFTGYGAPPNGDASGAFGPHIGMSAASAEYDATMQERFLWWTVRIIVIVFVLIALVLVAESV